MMSDVAPSDAHATAVDRYLTRAVPFGFSGAVLLATGATVRLARGYSMADRAGRRANRSTTVFSLGSITKPLTATAILALVDEGRLSLTDRLADLLPDVPADKSAITVEQMLSHTAGLPDAIGDDFEPGDRAEVVAAILAASLRFQPGTAYAYSNAGFSLLAAILEDRTEEGYEPALRRLVLDPAGMEATGYRLPGWNRGDLAHFYVGEEDLGIHLDKPYPTWHIIGNGEILSTVHDLHRFIGALTNGRLLRSATLTQAWTPRRGDYGLGWAVADGPLGRTVAHDGASDRGVSALLRWFWDRDTVLAILCNRDYSGGFLVHAVAPHVEALAFGGEAPLPPEVAAREPIASDDIAGTYETDSGGRITVHGTSEGFGAALAGQELLDLIAGVEGASEGEELGIRSLALIRALVTGDDAQMLAELDGDRQRLKRFRAFAADRIGSEADRIVVHGSLPAEISSGPALGVQLARADGTVEDTLRVFWREGRIVGLGYGTSAILDLPLVHSAPDRFVVHHLALGTTTRVSRSEGGALVLMSKAASVAANRRDASHQ